MTTQRVVRGIGRVGFLALGIAALGLGAITGCDNDTFPDDCFCTEEFRSVAVTIVDTAGVPIDRLDLEVTRVRDGLVFDPDQNLAIGPGSYVIMDDADKDLVGPSGEAVRVVASRDSVSVSADYVFATDDCLCHIEKVSGPDTLVWGAGT